MLRCRMTKRQVSGMATIAKLQKAGRAFLVRLIAERGPMQAAATLRHLADELEGLCCDYLARDRRRSFRAQPRKEKYNF